jgi:hypothetical protein
MLTFLFNSFLELATALSMVKNRVAMDFPEKTEEGKFSFDCKEL